MLSMWGAWSSTCALQTCPGLGAVQLALLTGHLQPPLTRRATHGSIRAAGKPVLAALGLWRVPGCLGAVCGLAQAGSGPAPAQTFIEVCGTTLLRGPAGWGSCGSIWCQGSSSGVSRLPSGAQRPRAGFAGLRGFAWCRRRWTWTAKQSRSWQTTWQTMCDPRSGRLHVHCPCLCIPNLKHALGSVVLCRVFASKATEEKSMRCVRAVAAAPVALP